MATKLEFLVAKLKVVLALATVSVAISSPVWELFAFKLAPAVADLYNASLCKGFLSVFKHLSVCLMPKVRTPTSVENDVCPIALTCQLATFMEGFTLSQVYEPVMRVLDPFQWVVSGKSMKEQIGVFFAHSA